VNACTRAFVRNRARCGVVCAGSARRVDAVARRRTVRRSKTKNIVAVDRILREVRLFDRESRAFLRFFVSSFVRSWTRWIGSVEIF
jgi:hypothetical protein